MKNINFDSEGLELRRAAAEAFKETQPEERLKGVKLGERKVKVGADVRKRVEQQKKQVARDLAGR